MNGAKKFSKLALLNILTEVLVLGALAVTLVFSSDIVVILGIYLLSYSFLHFSSYLYTKNTLVENNEREDDFTHKSKHFTLINIIPRLANHIDKIIIFQFLGPVQVAIYTFALIPLKQFGVFVDAVGRLAMPRFARHTFSELKKNMYKKTSLVLLFIALGVLAYILLAPDFFRLLYPRYMESVLLSQVMAVGVLFFARRLIPNALVAKGKTKALYGIRVTHSLVKIGLLLALLPFLGLWGAVVAYLVEQAIIFIVYRYFFHRA